MRDSFIPSGFPGTTRDRDQIDIRDGMKHEVKVPNRRAGGSGLFIGTSEGYQGGEFIGGKGENWRVV